ncbi:hypothetical protein F5I97DRAFT_1848975 [Phlebopus sp. FC_14]|nr:hypothetical protein F5I97DRAFT_1848975 [Phlebopus sp. FC_14]
MSTISSTRLGWRVELDREWDVLGPFPIHAREQHLLSPAYPLDLSSPITTTTTYPSSLTPRGYTSWSKTTADPHGTVFVSHPSVPWERIRATEGWAALQHINVLRGWLYVYPPAVPCGDTEPLLRTDLLRGTFFTILPHPEDPARKTYVPEWHQGNVYAMERAPSQLVRLPVAPKRNVDGDGVVGTKYEVIICGTYEIRLFGDPHFYASPSSYPVLTLNFTVSLDFPCTPDSHGWSRNIPTGESLSDLPHVQPLLHVPVHSMTPHIVDGIPFGDAIGVGVRCIDFGALSRYQQNYSEDRNRSQTASAGSEEGQGWWTITTVNLVRDSSTSTIPSDSLKLESVPFPSSLTITLLDDKPVRIAPSQTRIIPLRLSLREGEGVEKDVNTLDLEIIATCVLTRDTLCPALTVTKIRTHTLRVALPLTHVSVWTSTSHVPMRGTHFFPHGMVTAFIVMPPRKAFGGLDVMTDVHRERKYGGPVPILALHGAGVDILTQSFWADSLMRQKHAWVVMPQGRTAWGLDWHGLSAADGFAAVSSLSRILTSCISWKKWAFPSDTRIILMGHSNGGQGAWYTASRWPDKVSGVIPAAAYIKSQAYVPWSMSRFAHFVDPMLHAILETSLTPDDNDLFVGNLVGSGVPVLGIHGGEDENVPTWHTRELVGIMKTWNPDANVAYHEDPGQPHWYPEVLRNKRVQEFLDNIYSPSSPSQVPADAARNIPFSPIGSDNGTSTANINLSRFTLTVAVPRESGSLNGWQIRALVVPGILGRLEVTILAEGSASLRTTNICTFSVDLKAWLLVLGGPYNNTKSISLTIDGEDITITYGNNDKDQAVVWFKRHGFSSGQQRRWKLLHSSVSGSAVPSPPIPFQPAQRLQAILSTRGLMTLLVPSLSPSPELSAALRIAHDLQLFHALDAQIVDVHDMEVAQDGLGDGNLVVIGCAGEPLISGWLDRSESAWSYRDGAWSFGGRTFDKSSSAVLFLQPHPYHHQALSLFLQSTDPSGLERAVRLFPMRTGILSPDWMVVDGCADHVGAAGVEGAGVYACDTDGRWVWNERISWVN